MRVFVHQGIVTCISQQGLYEVNSVLQSLKGKDDYEESEHKNDDDGGDDGGDDGECKHGGGNRITPKGEKGARETAIRKWIRIVLKYHQDVVQPRITHLTSYSIDLTILDNDKPYFIEINPFGYMYSSGSALYHWLIDKNILYGIRNTNGLEEKEEKGDDQLRGEGVQELPMLSEGRTGAARRVIEFRWTKNPEGNLEGLSGVS